MPCTWLLETETFIFIQSFDYSVGGSLDVELRGVQYDIGGLLVERLPYPHQVFDGFAGIAVSQQGALDFAGSYPAVEGLLEVRGISRLPFLSA
jgi:hypothetical protein